MYHPYMDLMVVDLRMLTDEVFAKCKNDGTLQDTASPLLDLNGDSDNDTSKQLLSLLSSAYKSAFLRGMADQAECRARYFDLAVESNVTQALEAYEVVFQLTEGTLAKSLRIAVAIELSHLFGPGTNQVMVINDEGQLDAIDTRNFEDEKLRNGFITDDGYKLFFNQVDGIWTDGDFEFSTVYGKPELFGWPVDDYGLPLAGRITLV